MSAETSVSEIGYELDDGVLVIALSRPDGRNALTRSMISQFVAALDYADAADDVRAVVVTGTGRAFCAGADLAGSQPAFSQPADDALDSRRDSGGVLALRLFACSKPIVAAVNGDAVGVGASMVLPMDVRLAATSARFGFVQTKRGIVPEGCASWFLPRLVGISRALQWTLSGRLFTAQEALDAGLVHSLHTSEDLLPAALVAARALVSQSAPVSVATTRRMLWHALTLSHPMHAHRMETALVRALGSSPDAREGVASFLEKRPPRFSAQPSIEMASFAQWWPTPPFEATGAPTQERGAAHDSDSIL
jgi:enoyl-CoA hydratase/carnithine racemase